MARAPAPRYLIPIAGPLLLRGAQAALEEFAAAQSWWQSIPFGWLSLLLLAFGAGMLLQDWHNESSWLRENVRHLRKLFELESFHAALNTTPDKEWLELQARVRFVRTARNVRAAISAASATDVPHARQDFLLNAADYNHVEKDQRETYVLAVLPLARYDGKALGYQSWGNRFRESGDVKAMQPLHDETRNAVSIEVRAGWRRQTECMPFAVMSKEPAKSRVLLLGTHDAIET